VPYRVAVAPPAKRSGDVCIVGPTIRLCGSPAALARKMRSMIGRK
jgi:hypothetical protein